VTTPGPAGTPAGRPAGTPAGKAAGSTRAVAADAPATSTKTPEGAGTASAAAGPTPKKPRRAGAPWWLFALVCLLALAAAITAGVLLSRPSDADLRASAVEAGSRYTQLLVSYDASTLDDDVRRMKGVSTQEFAAEYDSTIAEVRDRIQTDRTVSVGTVRAVGVEELGEDSATVLVAVDQEITAEGEQPRTEASRVRMELVRQDGRWRVQAVERL
jgi:Mce-associated membrane protein